MGWKRLYFGFDGRIGRRQWWLAMLSLVAASLVLSFLANPLAWFSETIARKGPNLAETLFSIALLIPETAVTVKRFNDRDWPQWLPYGYALVFLISTLFDHHRLIPIASSPTAPQMAFIASLSAIVLIIIIDNGFLRGTVGPNRHGPDPVADDNNDDGSTAVDPAISSP